MKDISERKVTSVEYNWHQDDGGGEDYYSAVVGKNDVISIEYHEPKGEGDKHYCDIEHESGIRRVFNICSIEFE